jgi:spore photoproduct lyase
VIETIYIENDLLEHPRARSVMKRLPRARVVSCDHYGEVFNPHAQDFRLQKQNPSLLIARKRGRMVLPVPPGSGIGAEQDFYFSHLLNCPYDCRYCFLQGSYNSAGLVLFINYEDFMAAVDERIGELGDGERACFFSGYDGDSLALDAVTGFAGEFLSFFEQRPRAWLELRTRSVNTAALLARKPIDNCVVAFSLSPPVVADRFDIGAPPVHSRLKAMAGLARAGWKLGARLDPLLFHDGWERGYQQLIDDLFTCVPTSSLHSLSLGPLRFPPKVLEKMRRLHPTDPLLAAPTEEWLGARVTPRDIHEQMQRLCLEALPASLDKSRVFCWAANEGGTSEEQPRLAV